MIESKTEATTFVQAVVQPTGEAVENWGYLGQHDVLELQTLAGVVIVLALSPRRRTKVDNVRPFPGVSNQCVEIAIPIQCCAMPGFGVQAGKQVCRNCKTLLEWPVNFRIFANDEWVSQGDFIDQASIGLARSGSLQGILYAKDLWDFIQKHYVNRNFSELR